MRRELRHRCQNHPIQGQPSGRNGSAKNGFIDMSDITKLLRRAAANDPRAMDEVFALVYDDVHRMARARMAGNQPITLLDTTGLAHEAYLRLRNAERIDVASRAQLMAYVSQVLRAVIVDFA